ncbi:MAG TPA: serine hydrolase domain-containing protein [Conexibacter sp.]|nr:serine hydrolase domain-containing protein [Conexibacter sp.]
MTVEQHEIHGHVAAGFEQVAEAFRANFRERGELGAAFAALRDGELVVDLWGGVADADSGRPWTRDTLALVFSGTKGLAAAALLTLVERGALELDQPVARYWPEFGAAGKERVRVRDVLGHATGLPAFREPIAPEDLLDPERIETLLAAQEPLMEPGVGARYHAITWGWLANALARRVDGRTIGRLFADEVATPLGLDAWIGLPAEHEERVATLRRGATWTDPSTLPHADPITRLKATNPALYTDASFPRWNAREVHAAEIASANGIATARSLARLYGCLARGGELDGVRILSQETVALARSELTRGEEMPGVEIAFGAGFWRQTSLGTFGAPADAFGFPGAGGSNHAAWPSERVGFSYAMNEMRNQEAIDARSKALLDALHRAVT